METNSFRLPKKTGTYADAMAIAGLERLLYILGAEPDRIKDLVGFYELSLESSIDLDDLDYEAIHHDPGYLYIKFNEDSPVPLNYLDYPAERQKLLDHREQRKIFGDRPTDEQREMLRQIEPDPHWYLYQNIRVLKGFGPYNKLHEEIRNSDPIAFTEALQGELGSLATDKMSEVESKFAPPLSIVQAFTPSSGKGVNWSKTTRSPARTLKVREFGNWFEEYLKFLGMAQIADARAVGQKAKDIKLFAIVPGDIHSADLDNISRRFFRQRLPWSSAQIDVQGALGLAEALVEQLIRGKFGGFDKTPRDYVSGLQTAYFLEINKFPRAHSLANAGFVGLPDWFSVTEENANEWIEILEEHRRILRTLNEEHDEEAQILFAYRDSLSSGKVMEVLRFLAAYAAYLIRVGAKASSPAEWKRNVRQFTTQNLRRLMRMSPSFAEIVDDSGFQKVAASIRSATVREQYHNAHKNRIFEIEYGLFQELKRKASFRDQFIVALSDFISKYNAQNSRYYERTQGNPKRRRPQVTKDDLDRVIRLLDDKQSSEAVAMLLIAYGSASDFSSSNKPESSEDDVQTNEEGNTA